MLSLRTVLTTGLVIVSIACGQSAGQPPTPSYLKDGMMVMDACTASQWLVVDNQSGAAVRVVASAGIPSSMSSEQLGTIQNNRVDTLRYLSTGRNQFTFDADRPRLPSGAPQKTVGLHAWCIPKG